MPVTKDAPELLRPYIFHGVDLDVRDRQSTADCPFCDQNGKFSIKTETGQFRCLYCQEEGNAYSFMFRLHERSIQNTNTKAYQELAKLWGVSISSLKEFGLARSILTNEWLIPAHNIKGNLSNLYRCTSRKDERGVTRVVPMATPACKIHPFSTHLILNKPKPIVWVTEGVKDACALYDALNAVSEKDGMLIKTPNPKHPLYEKQGILPVPGCGNFDIDWLEVLAGKEVRICFDNDHPKRYNKEHEKAGEIITNRDGTPVRPGWDGAERVVKLIGKSKHRPKTTKVLFWNHDGNEPAEGHNPKLKDGYDLRDLFKEHGPVQALDILNHDLQTIKVTAKTKPNKKEKEDAPSIEPIHRDNFEDLCGDWASVLHFTQQLRDTLAIMLSVVLSTESEKVNHLWLRVIGPPGSGKSTLAEAISVAREWVAPKSLITGFHSGFVNPDDPDTNASLIPELDNKTVVMKDADTLANSPNRDKILSELRDLYDGTSRAHYRTMKADEFEDIRLSFILCGTDELRQLNRTFLGERFLDCEIMKRGEDHSPYLKRAGDNTWASLAGHLSPKDEGDEPLAQDRMMFLKQTTYGFIKHLKENYRTFPVPAINATTLERLQAMASFVALMRARIRHDHSEHQSKPRAELATRLTSQFTKLAFFVSLVLKKQQVDEEVLRLVLKVVHDTSIGMQFEITEQLAKDVDKLGVSVRSLTLGLNYPETSVRRQLGDMRQFDIAEPFAQNNNSGQRGRDRHLWCLTSTMRKLWDQVFNLQEPTHDNRHSGSKRKRQDVDRKKTPKPVQAQRNQRSRPRSRKG